MALLSAVPMQKVYDHYAERELIHQRLLNLLEQQKDEDFAQLAVGVSDPRANYSASEYGGGVLILQRSSARAIFDLAKELYDCTHPKHIPDIIYNHAIGYLKISVGSEISMMLRPNDFWVANVRTIWAYLLIKHAYNLKLANEELMLYKDGERDSEMDYALWSEMHRLLETSQVHLHDLGVEEAQNQKTRIGKMKYLWADAIANELYVQRSHRFKR